MSIPQPLLRDETRDPPEGWGVQAKRGQIPRNEVYIDIRRNDEGFGVTQPFDASTLLRAVSLSNGRWRFPTAS
jgi:hypothetical protein